MNERDAQCMFLSPVIENEIVDVYNCKNNISEDSDELSMSVLKEVFTYIKVPFTFICNLSFMNGIFPEKMKTTKVIPLFKSGNRKHFNNYKPVSILSQFSNILEKLFEKRLQSFIDKYSILSNSQYGFRSGCSTVSVLIELVEKVSSSVDNKKAAICVFIDLKKRSILLTIIYLYENWSTMVYAELPKIGSKAIYVVANSLFRSINIDLIFYK